MKENNIEEIKVNNNEVEFDNQFSEYDYDLADIYELMFRCKHEDSCVYISTQDFEKKRIPLKHVGKSMIANAIDKYINERVDKEWNETPDYEVDCGIYVFYYLIINGLYDLSDKLLYFLSEKKLFLFGFPLLDAILESRIYKDYDVKIKYVLRHIHRDEEMFGSLVPFEMYKDYIKKWCWEGESIVEELEQEIRTLKILKIKNIIESRGNN